MKLRIAAVVALALLATPIARRARREAHGVHTVGEVTALDAIGAPGELAYAPRISYVGAGGAPVALHGLASAPRMYEVGERVDVIYDGDDAAFGSPLARWWPWLLAVVACVALVAGGRLPLWLRPHLIGAAVVAEFLVVGSPDRTFARACVGVGATALTALAVMSLRYLACVRCTRLAKRCRCDAAALPRATSEGRGDR